MKNTKWFLFGIALALQFTQPLIARDPVNSDAQKKEHPLAPIVVVTDAQKKEDPNARPGVITTLLSWIGVLPDAQKKE